MIQDMKRLISAVTESYEARAELSRAQAVATLEASRISRLIAEANIAKDRKGKT